MTGFTVSLIILGKFSVSIIVMMMLLQLKFKYSITAVFVRKVVA